MEGVWVFGGTCRRTQGKLFKTVKDRSADTLIPIIEKYIAKGSTVYSDCWKAYSQLNQLGYNHQVANLSVEFKADDGTCTNQIKST